MQPLKILAIVIIALPISAFLLTLFLTDGAPLQPLAPGEESGPAAAMRALPLASLKRPDLEWKGSLVAAGHSPVYVDIAEYPGDEYEYSPAGDGVPVRVPVRVIDPKRDAELFMTLFGVRHSD